MPLFSIITINLNDLPGLKKTIESVRSQSFTDFEYIIIDGASTDGSIDFIKAHGDKINYWVSEKDRGIYDAMNKGIAVARGEYCLFLNSGDYLYREDTLQNVADRGLSADIIYGDVMQARNEVITGRKNSPDKISVFFLLIGGIPHQAQFIKRILFVKYGNYSTAYKISSDYEFFVRLFINNMLRVKHIPLPVSVFDISGISGNPLNIKTHYMERREIQKLYFPAFVFWPYSGFNAILRSPLMSNALFAGPLNYCRNLIMKLFRMG